MIDNRRHPRFKIDIPVVLRHAGRFMFAKAINVSEGGMFMIAEDRDVSSGSTIEIVFDLHGRKDLSAMGQIRHLERADDSSRMGVQFLSPFSEGVRAVRSFCGAAA